MVLNQKQIYFLNSHTKGTWSVNSSTGLVDIQGDFRYDPFQRSVKYPLRALRFGEVTGDFIFEAQPSEIKDLDGFPQKVGGNFSCSRCSAKSLKGGPIEVGGSYNCSFNDLVNFEYAPERINGDFIARFNHHLESFVGLPKYIKGDLNLEDGNPWQNQVDVSRLNTVLDSKIYGEIRFDSQYWMIFKIANSITPKGIASSDLLRVMIKRGIISNIIS